MTRERLIPLLVAAGMAGLFARDLIPAVPQSPRADTVPGVSGSPGEPAYDFRLLDCFGKEFKLSEFRGRIVVLEWLNQGCPVSRGAHEKGKMQDIYRKYAERGVIWLGIDSTAGATAEKDRVYAARLSLAYPILLDADGKVGHGYQARRTPHMFVIDPEGKVVYAGAIDDQKEKNYVAAAIEDLLSKRPVAKPKTDPYGCGIKYAKPT